MTEPLRLVPPPSIRAVWPAIREHVMALQAACREPWLPEDVFNDLATAKAFLWALPDLSGFLVVQVLDEPHGRDLHCWICYNRSGEPPIAYWDQLLDIARDNGCASVSFENDRPGFQRAIPGLRVRYSYRAEVGPGGDDGQQEDHHHQ